MQNAGIAVLSVVLAVGVAFAVSHYGRPGTEPAPSHPDEVTQALSDLRGQVEALTRRIEALGREGPTPARVETADSRVAEIEAVVRQVLAEQDEGAQVQAESAAINVDDTVAQLLEIGLMAGEAQEIWTRIREAGKLDEVIAAFERRARENPNSADAQAELGNALVQKLMSAKDYTEMGVLSASADRAYDEALDIDPNHWGARFSKAVSYTFWPDFMGKKAEAIEHFETLVTQQQSGATQARHVETYVILGNLYEQQGKKDKALETWRRGLAMHPDDPRLKKKAGR